MDILELLNKRTDKKILSYQNQSLTKSEFIDLVDSLYEKVVRIEQLTTRDFIVIREDHPIRFYPLIFALLKNGNRICLPNRDYLGGKEGFDFCEWSIQIQNGNVILNKESGDNPIILPDEGDLVVFSSGSTGAPKGILHNRNNLIKNAYSVKKELGIDKYVSLTPLQPYLVSALSHFLVHILSGSHLIFADFRDDTQITKWFRKYNDLSVVGSPMHIMTIIHLIPPGMSPRFFFSSGDFMYPVNIKKVLEKYPESQYFNTYGLAEIGGRFFINKIGPQTDYEFYSALGTNIEGTEYEIAGDQCFVKSESLFLGYIYSNRFAPSQVNHPTGDKVLEVNGIIELYGRVDDEIKIGGNKISLKHIEGKINNLFEDTCVLFDTRHPRLGTLFALAIYTDKIYSRSWIIERLKSELEPHELPHYFFYLKEIYYTQSAKIDRNKIKENVKELMPIT